MSKYNDLMNKVEVNADMKSRILLNIAKELDTEEIQETEEALEVEAVQEAEEIRETEGAQEVEGTQEAEGIQKVENVQEIQEAQGKQAVIVESGEVVDAWDDMEVEEEGQNIGEATGAAEIYVDEIKKATREADKKEEKIKEKQGSTITFEEHARTKRKAAIRRYVALAATFAVLFVGASAVMRMGGGREMASIAPASDSAMMEAASEAPMEMGAAADALAE